MKRKKTIRLFTVQTDLRYNLFEEMTVQRNAEKLVFTIEFLVCNNME